MKEIGKHSEAKTTDESNTRQREEGGVARLRNRQVARCAMTPMLSDIYPSYFLQKKRTNINHTTSTHTHTQHK